MRMMVLLGGYKQMLNFEEELKKFKPCLEVDDIEEAVYQEDLTDMTDLLKELQTTIIQDIMCQTIFIT